MVGSRSAGWALGLVLCVGVVARAGAAEVSDAQLVRHFEALLAHSYAGVRVDGLLGLAHLGAAASEAAPALAERLEELERPERREGSGAFERLAALWALARVGGKDEAAGLRERAAAAREHLLEGGLHEVAARTAFLAALGGGGGPERLLSRALPDLYNAARGEDVGERLLAAWALYEIDTAVTRRTADRALVRTAASLGPEAPRYSRHLRRLRLIGPPARPHVASRLRSLLAEHDFGTDLRARRAATIATLAALEHPEEPEALARYRARLPERLAHPLRDDAALRAMWLIGPRACSKRVTEQLEESLGEAEGAADRSRIRRRIEMCRPG